MLRARILSTVRPTTRVWSRSVHVTSLRLAAQVFGMPAMSPTMTEGGVVLWKFKPGDSFNAGDILLEVETDKATIDVEAADDGVLWKILINDGATGVPVGEPIAYTAEPGDDLLSLLVPDAPKKVEKVAEPKVLEPTKPIQSSDAPSKSSNDIFGPANPLLKLFPSVELLLQEHGISHDEAIKNIKASGPHGRLLLGDVLAHVGSIQKDDIVRVQSFVKTRQHLDLSAITLATPEELRRLQQIEEKSEKASAATEGAVISPPSNVRSLSLVSVIPNRIENFGHLVRAAVTQATRDVYAKKFPQYALSPLALFEPTSLFDDIMSPSVTQNRFEVVLIKCQEQQSRAKAIGNDCFFDDLMNVTPIKTTSDVKDGPVTIVVDTKIKLDQSAGDAQEFFDLFKDALRVRYPVEHLNIIG